MSREITTHTPRCLAVWASVTAGTVAAGAGAAASWSAIRPRPGPVAVPGQGFVGLLVALCAAALLLSLAWLWVVTTVTVVELRLGRVRPTGSTTRRLVLLACGAAVLAGASGPAVATGGDGASVLAGLPLPDRSVVAAHVQRRPPPSIVATSAVRSPIHVVRAGESLWSIAVGRRRSAPAVDDDWRAIWSANRDVIGADPDLILPGQRLRLPSRPDDQGDRR